MSDYLSQAWDWVYRQLPQVNTYTKEIEKVVVTEVKEMIPKQGHLFVRLAGVSGATAVIMGAYGAHAFKEREKDEVLRTIFETGSRYHFMHTLALLAVPLTRRPALVGSILMTGMVLFSGSCYYHALTGNTTIRKVTPYGGMLLILGWAAMIL